MEELDVINNWRFRADRVQQAHYLAGRRYERFNRYMGVPTTLIMAVVGTTIFSNLSENASGLSTELQIIVGGLSVLAAALSGIQTFLGFSELAEKHRLAGARYAHLKQTLELLECLNSESKYKDLQDIEAQWGKLREESPNLPQTVWGKIKKELTYDIHQKKYTKNKA